MEYKIVIKNLTGDSLGEIVNYDKLTFTHVLNAEGSCQFEMSLTDPNYQILAIGNRELYIYRDDDLVWGGSIIMASGTYGGTDETVTVYAKGFFDLLRARFTGYNREFIGIDAGEIVRQLLYETQNLTSQTNPLLGTISTVPVIGGHEWVADTDLGRLTYSPQGSGTAITDYIKSTNFGFNIPSNATINGIKIRIKTFQDGSGNLDTEVKLVIGGAIQTVNRGTNSDVFDDSFPYYSYGGEYDLWDGGLTPSIINSSDFGVVFAYTCDPHHVAVAVDVTLCPEITVFYTIPLTDDYKDFGITIGTIQTSVNRNRTYEYKCLYDAISELADVLYGFDFEVTDNKQFNVYYPSKGTDKSDNIIFEFGTNIDKIDFAQDFTEPANEVLVLGNGSGTAMVTSTVTDTNMRGQYKLRKAINSQKDVDDESYLEAVGQKQLNTYAYVVRQYKVTQKANTSPEYGDLSVGDWIRIRVNHGYLQIEDVVRIKTIQVDVESGKETIKYLFDYE